MSFSSSTTSLKPLREASFARLAKSPKWNKGTRSGSKPVNEKGDAGSGECETEKIGRPRLSLSHKQSTSVRKQRSDPTLAKGGVSNVPTVPSSADAEEYPSALIMESSSTESIDIPASEIPPKTPEEDRICEGLKNDPQLRSLCESIGISLHPDTIVGPIEKGQLIIGVLQDSLNELIKVKTRAAERKGKVFHIQTNGLDAAIRALENADRSLKTIKASKEPILGRNRSQQSNEPADQLAQEQMQLHLNQKNTEAVIRILTTAKEKFDKMGNGLDKLMTGLSFLSTRSGTSTVSSSRNVTAVPSRRTTGVSLLNTPVTPLNTTACSTRARSSVSSTSIGSRGNWTKGKTPSILL